MECFDLPLALHALIGVSLIVAGAHLMTHINTVSRGYGAYCFAFGYLLLGLSASGHDIGSFDFRNVRYLVALVSIVSIIAGTFMMYYHVEARVKSALNDNYADIVKAFKIEAVLIDTNIDLDKGWGNVL